MAILLTILLWLLGIFGALLLLVIFMPLGIRAVGAVEPWQADALVDARWAWGVIGVRYAPKTGTELRLFWLRVARIAPDSEKKAEKKAKKKERKRKKEKAKKERKRGLGWGWSNLPLFRRALRALHIRGTLRGTIGLGDPADTAMMALVLQPIASRMPGFDTWLSWDYIDEALDLEGMLQARIWPAELIWILLATLARGESRRALLATS